MYFNLPASLKAHALERTGNTDEALEICSMVKSRFVPLKSRCEFTSQTALTSDYPLPCLPGAHSNSTDAGVLSALSLTYKLMDLPDEATEAYENALTLDPTNVEMAQEVFFSHCRSFNFSKQQQFAMKLYKQVCLSG